MESRAMGEAVLPTMELLPRRIPKLSAAVLCTPDGFNICSLGVDEQQVGKLAALSGSLLSIGNATMGEILSGNAANQLDLLSLKGGNYQIIGIKVRQPDSHLVLLAAAPDTALGVMIVGAQYVARELEKQLGVPA